MKQVLILSLSGICMMPAIYQTAETKDPETKISCSATKENKNKATVINLSDPRPGFKRISSVVFKNQQFCRAEMPDDFQFDARFAVISANVYFSGANFTDVVKRSITSASLKPLEDLMKRCGPGTYVVFDDVKVVGPDKEVRTIPGVNYELY
ncbi:MAG: hypothetical protein QM737_23345 [Ferruginibacter sp.]